MALPDELNQLETAITAVGTAVHTKDSANATAITNEATTRSNADNAEANTRLNADIGLQNNINSETTRAEAAENTLTLMAGGYRGVSIISASASLTGDYWGCVYATATGAAAAISTVLDVSNVLEVAPKIAFVNNSSYPWTITLSNNGYVNSGQSSGVGIKQLVLPPGTSAEGWYSVGGGSLWIIGGIYAIGGNGPAAWRGLFGISTATQAQPADPWGFIFQTVGTVSGNLATNLPAPTASLAGKRFLFTNNSSYNWTLTPLGGYIVSSQNLSGATLVLGPSTVAEIYCDGSNYIVQGGNYVPNSNGRVTVSSAAPSGGSPGDTWFQV